MLNDNSSKLSLVNLKVPCTSHPIQKSKEGCGTREFSDKLNRSSYF